MRTLLIIVLVLAAGYFLRNNLFPSSEPLREGISREATVVAPPTPDSSATSISSVRRNGITRAVKKVSPSVVSVNVTKIEEHVQRSPYYVDPFIQRFFPEIYRDRRYRERIQSIGSGFIISPDGYIVTNDHVAGHGVNITVNTPDGKEYKAHLIGSDPISDIALLKIDVHDFPSAPLDNSDGLIIGEWAIAIGNPFGLFNRNQPTVTVGVISAVNRDFGRVKGGRIYQDMIQTDAAINKGNSGGPLCNAAGEVIGMNTFIFTGDNSSSGSVGIGFAIPISRIKKIVAGLKNNTIDRDFWIGLSYMPLNKYLARQMGYPKTRGIYIARIIQNSPAEKAGLHLGDILLEINHQPVVDDDSVDKAMGSEYLKVGDRLPVKVWREGNFKDLILILEKRKTQ